MPAPIELSLTKLIIMILTITGLILLICTANCKGLIKSSLSSSNSNSLSNDILNIERDGAKWRSSFLSWSSCGSSSDPVQLRSFSISPNPIKVPGTISVAFAADLGMNETSPVPLSLVIKKKVGLWWVELPCEEGLGSCNYPDGCAKIEELFNPCPEGFQKAGLCRCPVQSGHYEVPMSPLVTLKAGVLPSWLEDGHYRIQANVNNASGQRQFCVQVEVDLTKA